MRKLTTALVALLVLGCDGDFSSLESGTMGKYRNTQDAYVVVRDDAAWRFLYAWAHQGSTPAAPSVNFGTDVVAGTFLGFRASSGYGVSITNCDFSNANDVTATVTETSPAPGTIVLWVITKPYAFTKITRHDGVVRFVKNGTTTVGTEKSFAQLATEDYQDRKAAYEAQNEPWPAAPTDPILVSTGSSSTYKCPIDNSVMVAATLPATGSYTDVANKAYFCKNDAQYWILHTQGAFVGTVSYWWGPFTPGSY